MFAFRELLAAPFAACILIAALHCYMGLHVVKRGVIFVDLSLAQMAALGSAVAILMGPILDISPHGHNHSVHYETSAHKEATEKSFNNGHQGIHEHSEKCEKKNSILTKMIIKNLSYILSLVFAFIGALIFTLGRFKDERVPHEAIIGIVFVVASALTVLILSKAPHGHEKMEAMLVGSILFVSWRDVLNMLFLYLPLGILHYAVRHILMKISKNISDAESSDINVRAWDLLFYASFALMVTQSVSIAGVLVVFSYLIIPAVCAIMLVDNFFYSLLTAWGIALLVSFSGLGLSAWKDLPTGPSLVVTFGAFLVLCATIRALTVWKK